MSMYCYKCQETLGNKNCRTIGVCGKTEEVAAIQDYIVYVLKGIGEIVVKEKLDVAKLGKLNKEVLRGLFMTITNANFNSLALYGQLARLIELRENLNVNVEGYSPATRAELLGSNELISDEKEYGSLRIKDVNRRSYLI